MNAVMILLKRDIRNSFGKRFFLMLGIMLLFQVWFTLTSDAVQQVRETGQMSYMAAVFAINFLGSIVALALNSNGMSAERESKMLDLVLTSGVSKRRVYLCKMLACFAASVAFALAYTTALALIYSVATGDLGLAVLAFRYWLPVASFFSVFSLMGLTLSIALRSSRSALIAALLIGALLMPRLFVMMIDGVAKLTGMSQSVTEIVYLLSPAMIMNALSGYSTIGYALWGSTFLVVYLAVLIGCGCSVFVKQDERNNGE